MSTTPPPATVSNAGPTAGLVTLTGIAGLVVAVVQWLTHSGGTTTDVVASASALLSSAGLAGLVTHARTILTTASNVNTSVEAAVPVVATDEAKVRAWVQDEIKKIPGAPTVEELVEALVKTPLPAAVAASAPVNSPAASVTTDTTPHLAGGGS